MSWMQWAPYVPVAERRRQAAKKMAALRKKGVDIQPISIEGRKIAKTFWGEAWCDHLESFSDFENRLPRGRTYVRNGSVCHLAIAKGKVEAKVSGSEIYNVKVVIQTLLAKKWKAVKTRCAGQIGSLIELLRGDLSGNIMEVVTDREAGLFPLPDEISFDCDCPDWAVMCKHVAAVLYGVGARLDEQPALLFQLRGVNQDELIDADAAIAVPTRGRSSSKRLAADDLGDVFGIDLSTESDDSEDHEKQAASKAKKTRRKVKKTASKKGTSPKTASTSGRSSKRKVNAILAGKKKVARKKKATRKSTKKRPASTMSASNGKKPSTARKKTAKKKTRSRAR